MLLIDRRRSFFTAIIERRQDIWCDIGDTGCPLAARLSHGQYGIGGRRFWTASQIRRETQRLG